MFYNGHIDETTTYPKSFNDMYLHSSELIHAWAEKTMYEGDAPYMQKFISEYLDEQFGNNPNMSEADKVKYTELISTDIDLVYDALKETTKKY